MKLVHALFRLADRIRPAQPAFAHCDIPCGIYDPISSQLAAMTVIRMNQLIAELKMGEKPTLEERNAYVSKLSRLTAAKEEHAEKVKHEIRILIGDYFKPEHAEKHPDLRDLVWKSMKVASTARQNVDMKAAQELLDVVNKIAEIFWETKGIKTKNIKASNPTAAEIVVPVF